MSKTIVVVGFGPGISNAVAEKFGAEGFSVALVARSQERLDAGAEDRRNDLPGARRDERHRHDQHDAERQPLPTELRRP